jgi:hypothetical protein
VIQNLEPLDGTRVVLNHFRHRSSRKSTEIPIESLEAIKLFDFSLSQLLLNGAIDTQSTCVINDQAISFGEILELVLPVIVEGSFGEAV